MSVTHASLDIFHGSAASERGHRPINAIAALIGAARDLATRQVLVIRHRTDMRRLDRFSDHSLEDIGFERDWDGTVVPRQP